MPNEFQTQNEAKFILDSLEFTFPLRSRLVIFERELHQRSHFREKGICEWRVLLLFSALLDANATELAYLKKSLITRLASHPWRWYNCHIETFRDVQQKRRKADASIWIMPIA